MATQSFVRAWFHVEEKSDSAAQCLICGSKIKSGREEKGQKSFSTSPLHTHMKTHYQEEYKKGKKESEMVSSSTLSSQAQPKEKKLAAMKKQFSLENNLTSKKIWDINDSHSRTIHKKIIKMMALDNQPFTMVEDDGFIDLMAHLLPHYMLANKMLPEVYKELRTIAEDELA